MSRQFNQQEWDRRWKDIERRTELLSQKVYGLQTKYQHAPSLIDLDSLRESIANQNNLGRVSFIRDLDLETKNLNIYVRRELEKIVKDSYVLGLEKSNYEMAKQGLQPRFSASIFRKVDKTTVDYITNKIYTNISARTTHMSQQFKSTFQSFLKDELLDGYQNGRGLRVMSKRLAGRMAAEGFDSFTDAAGRRISIHQHSARAIRTEAMTAHNQANISNYTANGIKKFQISHHASSCKTCQKYEGKIYTLEELLELPNGGPPFHPNCRHVIKPVVELEYLNDQDKAEKDELERQYAETRKRKREENLKVKEKKEKEQAEAEKARKELELERLKKREEKARLEAEKQAQKEAKNKTE